ncbi:MAG: hypothetical protein COU85_01405 [Candidatus Portnoybacteria bacterium CG10_big_fil_rev_8_21_14_0_10_44_7]|uniref:Uncharacterized protein n=1 Tax=Candidatus Portnoybacteria bacterium CG10_big_fil_rev_8_21_14_0_10_44_7 TaxID=1974816 RepID=A0A2M8KIV8_9BACT|nr:MAG: hypothetical protein COU85_01405 [Candidatus Portnoybacteria bacterium CG10_big_fil_rev_8_21_14_0_10_44_7]
MSEFFNESGSHWRIMANAWMGLTLFVFTLTIFYPELSRLADIAAIIYIAVLSIYAGTKECNRWSHYHTSRHQGEISVIVWTIFIIVLIGANLWFFGQFEIPGNLIAVYTAVLAIFAVTQKSKHLFAKHELKCKGVCPICGHNIQLADVKKEQEPVA